MEEFLLVIHRDYTSENQVPTPEQMKEAVKPYQEWIAGLAASGNLAAPPKRWDLEGRIVRQSAMGERVTAGPYRKGRKSIGGVLLIKCNDYEEAVKIAQGCPIVQYGAIVELRKAIPVT